MTPQPNVAGSNLGIGSICYRGCQAENAAELAN